MSNNHQKFCSMCTDAGLPCEYSWRCEYFLNPGKNSIRRAGAVLMAYNQAKQIEKFQKRIKPLYRLVHPVRVHMNLI